MKEKRFNKYIIVFIFYLLFIIVGISAVAVIRPVGGSVFRLITGNYSVQEAKDTINEAMTDELTYHSHLMDLNSLKENMLGNKVLRKDDAAIAKSENGSLMDVVDKIDETEIAKVAEIIEELKETAESNGAEFLYCAAPKKELYEIAPSNVNNYFKYNYHTMLSYLGKADIPYVDFSEKLPEAGIPESEIFYYTDHHWKVSAGFAATTILCEELNARYGFIYNKDYTDIANYNVKNYPEWFLGSQGKKTGKYFSWHGADDFQLITPKFKTHLSEEQPFKQQIREGSFEDSVLYMENLEKDYYKLSTYTTYSGGDFRLQIMKNLLNPEGKKVLMIRDSSACVVAPFLALHTGELHICDVRDDEHYVGAKINMKEYIKQIQPDYVLVLYTNVGNSADPMYDFFAAENSLS